MDLSAFHNQFREETAENIRVLGDGLLAIEAADDPGARRAALDRVFRAMHTVKGSARMLGFDAVSRLAHTMESLLGELRQNRRALDRPLADALLRAGDALLALTTAAVENTPLPLDADALIAVLEAAAGQGDKGPAGQGDSGPAGQGDKGTGGQGDAGEALRASGEAAAPSPPPPLPPSAPVRPQGRQTVRVRVDRLDRMLNLAGELVVGQQALDDHASQLVQLQQLADQHERALKALEGELARLRFSPLQREAIDTRLAALRTVSEQIDGRAGRLADRFARHAGQHNLLVKDLEQEVMAARLLPIGTVYAGLPRAVRDLAQATGKQVRIELRGETTELDRKVLELINDPLLHLVRNAVDHGVEPPAARTAAGKPAEGVVEVSAEAAGGEVRVVVADDGRGIDPQRLRDRAVRGGLMGADRAARLSDAEALELIFQPGFSTAQMLTDISGRGVGMDVVLSNITELGGQVRVESQVGHGTRIVLVLPLTLVTTRVLLVRVGAASFALPAAGCQGTIWIRRPQIHSLEGQPTIEHEGRTIAVVPMADLLGVEGSAPFLRAERARAVLVGSGQATIAMLVDALLDEREAVVKPLGALLGARRVFGGAVQLGDGSLVLLVNPLLLSQEARGARAARPEEPAPRAARRRLLVADDSFTTRELIRSILQSAGYDVAAAVDGADALDKLRSHSYDLVVSDVEMPRVDGFQLSSRIRDELHLRDLPVVLITSLASEEHRRQGLEAGARAYIVKSQFNQDSLLEVIRQLLGPGA